MIKRIPKESKYSNEVCNECVDDECEKNESIVYDTKSETYSCFQRKVQCPEFEEELTKAERRVGFDKVYIWNIGDYQVKSLRWSKGITNTVHKYGRLIFHTAFGTELIDSEKKAQELIDFTKNSRGLV